MWLIRTAITLQVTNVHSKIEFYALEHKIYNFPKLKSEKTHKPAWHLAIFVRTTAQPKSPSPPPLSAKSASSTNCNYKCKLLKLFRAFAIHHYHVAYIHLHLHHLYTTHTHNLSVYEKCSTTNCSSYQQLNELKKRRCRLRRFTDVALEIINKKPKKPPKKIHICSIKAAVCPSKNKHLITTTTTVQTHASLSSILKIRF